MAHLFSDIQEKRKIQRSSYILLKELFCIRPNINQQSDDFNNFVQQQQKNDIKWDDMI